MRNLFSHEFLCRVGKLLVWATFLNLNIGWSVPLYALTKEKRSVKITPTQKRQLAKLRSIVAGKAVRPDFDCNAGAICCKDSSSDDCCIELEEILECLKLLKELTGEPSGDCGCDIDDCDVTTIFGLLECILQEVEAIDCDIDLSELKNLIKKIIVKICSIDSKVDIILEDCCGGGGGVSCCDELNGKLDELIDITVEIDEKVDEISEVNEKIDDLTELVDGVAKDVRCTKTKVCTIETVVNKINSKIDALECCNCESSSSNCDICSSSDSETQELVEELTIKVDELTDLIVTLGEKVDDINSCQCGPQSSSSSSSSSSCCSSSLECDVCQELADLNEKADETNSKLNSVDGKVNKIGQKVCTIEVVVNKINSKIDDLDCASSSGCCSSSSDLACCEDILEAVATVQETLDGLVEAQDICCESLSDGIGQLDEKLDEIAQVQEDCCDEIADISEKVNKVNQKVCCIEVVVNKINSKIDSLDCKDSSDFGCCSSSSSSRFCDSSSSSFCCDDSSSCSSDLECCEEVLSKVDEIIDQVELVQETLDDLAVAQESCCEVLQSKVDSVKQAVVVHDATNTAEHIIILNELNTIETKLDDCCQELSNDHSVIEQLIIDHDLSTGSKLDQINKKLCTIERKIDCLDKDCSEEDICDQLHQLADDVDTISTLLTIHDLRTGCELIKLQSCCETLNTKIGDLCSQVNPDPCAIFDPNAECFSLVEWLKLIYLKVK